MIYEVIQKIEQTLQTILIYLMNLCFQPIYILIQMVQQIIDIWDAENTIDPPEEKTNVTLYQSTNEGKAGTEFDDYEEEDITTPPIGYRINHDEQDEIKRIKEQLNK